MLYNLSERQRFQAHGGRGWLSGIFWIPELRQGSVRFTGPVAQRTAEEAAESEHVVFFFGADRAKIQ